MTEDEQLAESIKYSSALIWHIAEPRPGLFVLYNYKRHPVLLTENWAEVLEHYRARPVYVSKPRVAPAIDLSKLEFRL